MKIIIWSLLSLSLVACSGMGKKVTSVRKINKRNLAGFQDNKLTYEEHSGRGALIYRARNNPEMTKSLLKGGLDLNAVDDERGQTTLIALAGRSSAAVIKPLLAARADVNIADNDGGTALMYAAHGRNNEVVILLLQAEADVNIADNHGRTALMYAAKACGSMIIVKSELEEKISIMKDLLAAGANLHAVDNDKKTVLMYEVSGCGSERASTEFLLAVGTKATINAGDKNGDTALMHTADRSSPQPAQVLLEAGADLDIVNNDGKTVLDIAKAAPHGNAPYFLKILKKWQRKYMFRKRQKPFQYLSK